jgi:chromate transporter
MEEDAVEKFQWLSQDQFLDGIALSGVLPAPLIIFSAFAGYAALGFPGALLITLGIFLPAFSFTLLGHNFFQRVIQNKSLHSFLDGVTASVIGIIAVTAVNLFITTITDWLSAVVCIGALMALLLVKSKFMPVYVILVSGAVMLIYYGLV